MGDHDIEQMRLELDRERLELERRNAARDARLLNKHFGAIITAVVSVAAVVVSFAQIQVAEIQKSRELEAQQVASERAWKIEAAKFVATNREAIFSEDDRERESMQHVISVAFPKEIGDGLIGRVRQVESGKLIRRFWKPDGSTIDKENMAAIQSWLNANGVADESITFFLRAASYEAARLRAVEELGLRARQQTITNVPQSSIAAVTSQFAEEGATVATRRQPDGLWTVTATYSDQ